MAPRGRRASTSSSYRERVLRALVEIERDPGRAPELDALAREACLSPFHFHRVFSAVVGEAPAEYARRLRLERAAHDLSVSEDAVSAIARRAGYARQESFTRAFQARYGATPSAFRAAQKGRWAATPKAPGESRTARVEEVPPLRVAFIRHVGPYEQAPAQFDRLAQWAGARAKRRRQSQEPLFLGIAHDNPALTPASLLRFDCCVAVFDDLERGEGDVGIQTLFGGRYAAAVHQGSFTTLAQTYAWLAREFLPSHQLVLRRAPAVEIYLTPPDVNATDGITEVLLPV
jgi:AraC family transcriptional regulator